MMAVYERGKVYWYHFVFNGERIQESTKQCSKRVAEQIEAARKTQLAKGELGIADRKPVPTLREFAAQFEQAIETQCSEKPRTVQFYKAKVKRLLADESLASSKVDHIDEAAIEAYTQKRARAKSRRKKVLASGSVNRELANSSPNAAVGARMEVGSASTARQAAPWGKTEGFRNESESGASIFRYRSTTPE